MKRHREVCPYEETSCKYVKLGCGIRMKRKDIATHEEEDDKLHLHKALDAITSLEDAITSLEKKGDTLGSGESLTFKVTEYSRKKRSNETATSLSFYTPNGHHMTITVYVNGRDRGKSSHISVSTNANFGTVTITLLNQLIDEQHYTKTGRDFPTFIPHTMLDYNPGRKTHYLKDDTLYFRVTVDIPNHKPWLECRVKKTAR